MHIIPIYKMLVKTQLISNYKDQQIFTLQ